MKNGKWIILAAVVVLAGIGIWFWQSSSSENMGGKIAEKVAPEMEVVSFDISNINKDQIDATSKVRLTNPLPVEIKTNRIDYEIFIDSIRVIKDAYNKPVRIASSDSTEIELPMKILADPMKEVLEYFDKNNIDSADYAMNITFQVDVPVAGEEEFDIDLSKRMPAIRIPEVEIENVDLNILSSGDGVEIEIKIYNPNLFPIKMKDGSFALTIEKDLEVVGQMEDYVNIPERGTEIISIYAEKDRGSMFKTGWNLLTDKKGTGFKYIFSCILESDNNILDDTKMEMNVEGTLDEIADAI